MATILKRSWVTDGGETRIAWRVNFVNNHGKRERKTFASRREADDFRIKVEGQVQQGLYRPDATKVSLKEVADLYLDSCKRRMERRERMTRRNYEVYSGHVRNYICPDIARHAKGKEPSRLIAFTKGLNTVKLSQLTPGRVEQFRDDLRDAGVSVTTTRRILGTLAQVLRYAISKDYVSVNSAAKIKVIGRRDEGSKKIIPPSKELIRMLLIEADADFRVKLMFAAATGVRAGELHALRWKHLNLTTGYVKVETRVDAHREEDVTKTAAGMREIPLSGPLILALKEWRLRSKFKKQNDLVFPGRIGTYVGHDNMVKRKFHPLFAALRKRYADDPGSFGSAPTYCNWHALRHFAISCWIEADLKPKTVQTFAGHSSLHVTMDRYGHLFKSDDHRAAMDAIAHDAFG